jgi:hypothetical protein
MNARNLILTALCAVLATYCFNAAYAATGSGPGTDRTEDLTGNAQREAAGRDKIDDSDDDFTGMWFRIAAADTHTYRLDVPAGETIIGLSVAGDAPLVLTIIAQDGKVLATDAAAGGVACGFQLHFERAQTISVQIHNPGHDNNGYSLVVL